MWYIGNIGHECGTISAPLVAAYACYPTINYLSEDSWIILTTLVACLVFDTFSKKWRLRRNKKQGKTRRAAIFLLSVTLYLSLWSSYLYFNATITDGEGEEIKLSDAVKHFFTSPIWTDLKVT